MYGGANKRLSGQGGGEDLRRTCRGQRILSKIISK